VELRLRVWKFGEEVEEIVRVRPDSVDLTVHTGLVALPEELRAWMGDLTGITEFQVDGMESYGTLRELPDAVGQLTKLNTLKLRGCPAVKVLPQGLSSLTEMEDLLIMHF
jgi:hypothetical protein